MSPAPHQRELSWNVSPGSRLRAYRGERGSAGGWAKVRAAALRNAIKTIEERQPSTTSMATVAAVTRVRTCSAVVTPPNHRAGSLPAPLHAAALLHIRAIERSTWATGRLDFVKSRDRHPAHRREQVPGSKDPVARSLFDLGHRHVTPCNRDGAGPRRPIGPQSGGARGRLVRFGCGTRQHAVQSDPAVQCATTGGVRDVEFRKSEMASAAAPGRATSSARQSLG